MFDEKFLKFIMWGYALAAASTLIAAYELVCFIFRHINITWN